MEISLEEFLKIAPFLIPGLIAAWVFYGLTSYDVPPVFERLIQAIIFTLLIYVAINLDEFFTFGKSIGAAVGIGVFFSILTNHDALHKILRKLKITRESSYPSQWYAIFTECSSSVILTLNDDVRLSGWIESWPASQEEGHFLLKWPMIVGDDNNHVDDMVEEGVTFFMVPVSKVKFITFMDTSESELIQESSF